MIHTLNNLIGDIRGYGRSSIRRQVAQNAQASPQTITEKSDQKLRQHVISCLQQFPLYARYVEDHCGHLPQTPEQIILDELPIWTKVKQRELFASLDEPPIPGAFVHATGGSTGVPTQFYMTRESYEWRTAVSDRGYSWAGAEPGRRAVFVWGAPVKEPTRFSTVKNAMVHRLQNRWFFNSFDFSDNRKRECCDLINRVKPEVLIGYAGNLVDLAMYCDENPKRLQWKTPRCITAAEGLLPEQRTILQQQLTDEVFMSYGSREFMLIAMEAQDHSGLYLSEDNLIIEMVDDRGQPLPDGETGRILITDLHNNATPFIRYEIGDLGALAPRSDNDILPFRKLAVVNGRTQEKIVLADGSERTALLFPHLLKEFDWITGYQVQHEAPGTIQLRLLSNKEISTAESDAVSKLVRSFTSPDLKIDVVRVDRLEQTQNGKTPIVIGA
jgi:phenylacetate-CoA ligase